MPNVRELVQRTYDRLNHNPDLAQYKSAVLRFLNDGYEEVNEFGHWLFLQATTDLQIRATVTGTAANTVTVSSVRRRVTASGGTTFRADWEGQTYVHLDASEYTIAAVDLSVTPNLMYLSSPYPTIGLTTTPTWSVRFDRYALPRDCSEVLGIVSRNDDEGRIVHIDRKREERLYLDRDDTGEPSVSIEDDWRNDRAPAIAPVLVNNAGLGNLPASTELEYMYTIFTEGRESPPSPPASIVTGAGASRAVDISALEDLSWSDLGGAPQETGKQKWIYRRDVTRSGPWRRIGIVTASATTTFQDSVLVPVATAALNPTGDEDGLLVFLEAGPREHLRMWTTPDTDKIVRLRYHRRPRRLFADTDVPVWPTQYHHALVDLTMAGILESHGLTEDAARARGRAEKIVNRMAGRHMARTDRAWRFGRVDQNLGVPRSRWGTPTMAP